jgi:hypothetical protein
MEYYTVAVVARRNMKLVYLKGETSLGDIGVDG